MTPASNPDESNADDGRVSRRSVLATGSTLGGGLLIGAGSLAGGAQTGDESQGEDRPTYSALVYEQQACPYRRFRVTSDPLDWTPAGTGDTFDGYNSRMIQYGGVRRTPPGTPAGATNQTAAGNETANATVTDTAAQNATTTGNATDTPAEQSTVQGVITTVENPDAPQGGQVQNATTTEAGNATTAAQETATVSGANETEAANATTGTQAEEAAVTACQQDPGPVPFFPEESASVQRGSVYEFDLQRLQRIQVDRSTVLEVTFRPVSAES